MSENTAFPPIDVNDDVAVLTDQVRQGWERYNHIAKEYATIKEQNDRLVARIINAESELAAYHKFHEAISGKVGFLRAEWGDPKEHADAISEAFRVLHDERVEIAHG